MAVTLSDIRKKNFAQRESDLEKSLGALKEKYGFDFDIHCDNIKPNFKINFSIGGLDGIKDGDGTSYIRIDKGATTELGKFLRITHPRSFFTWVG